MVVPCYLHHMTRVCLSKEQSMSAWNRQYQGKSDSEVFRHSLEGANLEIGEPGCALEMVDELPASLWTCPNFVEGANVEIR